MFEVVLGKTFRQLAAFNRDLSYLRYFYILRRTDMVRISVYIQSDKFVFTLL